MTRRETRSATLASDAQALRDSSTRSHVTASGKRPDSRHSGVGTVGATDHRVPMSEVVLLCALLVAAVAMRLINISQPFIDAYSWRQSDVAMLADNFYRHGFNIFYPQMSYPGDDPGYVGTEFPLVPFLASLLYVIFGVQDWIGRSISVFFFALSVFTAGLRRNWR